MVKKGNPKMVWEKQQKYHLRLQSRNVEQLQNNQQKRQQTNILETKQLNAVQQNQARNILKSFQYQSSSSEQFQSQRDAQIIYNVQITQNKQNISDIQNCFQVTPKLIQQLDKNIYKKIVLSQFIQTNQNNKVDEIKQNIKSSQNLVQKNESQNEIKVKEQQRLKITEFISEQPLDIPTYTKNSYTTCFKEAQKPSYGRLERSLALETQVRQTGQSQIASSLDKPLPKKTAWPKRTLLTQLHSILLQPLNIKFLNIYGPPGSGKTFTLKSIIKQHLMGQEVIWMNGMNITNGKMKKFISNVKDRFDALVWDIYTEEKEKDDFQNQLFIENILNNKRGTVLIIDEYDQATHLNLLDLLRYAYISKLQTKRNSNNIHNLSRISKAIFISNSFNSIQQTFVQNNKLAINSKSIHYKHLLVQDLIFQPFVQTDAYQIVKNKIIKVNQKFIAYVSNINKENNKITSIFKSDLLGIFALGKIKQVIKKVCFSDYIDIRKILSFYAKICRKWIQQLYLTELRYIIVRDKKLVTYYQKCQGFLVDDNFIVNRCFGRKPSKIDIQLDDRMATYLNPIELYVSTLQNQGKISLKALYQCLVHIQNQRKIQLGHQKTQLDIEACLPDIQSRLQFQRKKTNYIKIHDIHDKIKTKVKLQKIYPWIYEWQQTGLIKIYSFKQLQKPIGDRRMVIDKNVYIEVLDRKSIQFGVGIY